MLTKAILGYAAFPGLSPDVQNQNFGPFFAGWFKLAADLTGTICGTYYNQNGAGLGWKLWIDSGRLKFQSGYYAGSQGLGFDSGIDLPVGQWFYLDFRTDGMTYKIKVDGVLRYNYVLGGGDRKSINCDGGMFVGKQAESGYAITDLQTAQIQYGVIDGLAGHANPESVCGYLLEEGTGTVLHSDTGCSDGQLLLSWASGEINLPEGNVTEPDCNGYRVRLLLDIPVVDFDNPEVGQQQYLLSNVQVAGQENQVNFAVLVTDAVWKYKIRRIDLVLEEGPFWGNVLWERVDKNGDSASFPTNIFGSREILIDSPYSKGIPIYDGGENPESLTLDPIGNFCWLALKVEMNCGEPGEIGGGEPIPPEPPDEPEAPEEEGWPTGYGGGDDTLIIVEPPGTVTPPTFITIPTGGTVPEGCECFEYLVNEQYKLAGYLGEILESVREEVFVSRRENNELLLRIETAILQEAAKNRNNLILRGLELLERLLAMKVDLGPLIAELSDGRTQSETNTDTMKQAIEGLATAIEEASCCEPICERLEKIAKGVYFDEAVGEEEKSLAANTNLLLAGLNIWK